MKAYVQMHMPSFRMITQSPYRFWYCQSLYGLSFVCKYIFYLYMYSAIRTSRRICLHTETCYGGKMRNTVSPSLLLMLK